MAQQQLYIVLLEKVYGDVYIDDKAININAIRNKTFEHQIIKKNWGEEKFINDYKYIAKILKIKNGKNISLQKLLFHLQLPL